MGKKIDISEGPEAYRHERDLNKSGSPYFGFMFRLSCVDF